MKKGTLLGLKGFIREPKHEKQAGNKGRITLGPRKP